MIRTGLYAGGTGRAPALAALALAALLALLAGCTQSRNAATQSWSGVAVAGESVFVGNREGRLVQLSIEGGVAQLAPYQAPQPDQGQGFPAIYGTPVVSGGRVYAGTYNGVVFSLDASSLGDARAFEIDGNDLAKGIAGSVAVDGGAVVVAAAEDAGAGRLYVLDAANLVERCRYPARNEPPAGQLWTTPVIRDGAAYFGDLSHQVHAVSLSDCRPIWDAPAKLGGAIVAPPVIVNGRLHLGAFDREFYAVDAATGATERLFEAGGWFWGGAAADGSMLYVPNMDGNIYAYDAAAKRIAWIYPGGDEPNEPALAAPVVAGDRLVYASDSGVLAVLDARSGNRLWDRRARNEVRAPLTTAGSIVFLHSLDETITAIDLDTKQLVWERSLSDAR